MMLRAEATYFLAGLLRRHGLQSTLGRTSLLGVLVLTAFGSGPSGDRWRTPSKTRPQRKCFTMGCITIASAALSSCAHLPSVEPQIVTKTVEVPVAVRCIDPALIPAEPGTIALPIDARLAADLAASKSKELRVWGRALLALIGPCTK